MAASECPSGTVRLDLPGFFLRAAAANGAPARSRKNSGEIPDELATFGTTTSFRSLRGEGVLFTIVHGDEGPGEEGARGVLRKGTGDPTNERHLAHAAGLHARTRKRYVQTTRTQATINARFR